MECAVLPAAWWIDAFSYTEEKSRCLLAEQGGISVWTLSVCSPWPYLLHCKFLFSSLRDLYSQFLKEMIIQPGIAKANLGVSREDVTLEDHVSVFKPLCCRKFLGDFSGPLGYSWLCSQLFCPARGRDGSQVPAWHFCLCSLERELLTKRQ